MIFLKNGEKRMVTHTIWTKSDMWHLITTIISLAIIIFSNPASSCAFGLTSSYFAIIAVVLVKYLSYFVTVQFMLLDTIHIQYHYSKAKDARCHKKIVHHIPRSNFHRKHLTHLLRKEIISSSSTKSISRHRIQF